MTKLKDLNKYRKQKAKGKQVVKTAAKKKMVENKCGCLVDAESRFWVVKLPLMPTIHLGKPATIVTSIVQCSSCKCIVDGRGEIEVKREPIITLTDRTD
jgi:hypothetical protein